MLGTLKIYKMAGSGNDFVIVDNRQSVVPEADIRDLARSICPRRVSVGADGLILIEQSDSADFKMRIMNPDGSEAEMCGNGSRCVFMLAGELGISSGGMSAETIAGVIKGEVKGDRVAVQMPDVKEVRDISLEGEFGKREGFFLDTGVPHTVIFADDLSRENVVEVGRAIRHHDVFQPAGTNVDFVGRASGPEISIRTYERGVENETLSCGTGSVAAALTHGHVSGAGSPISVRTKSGEILIVSFVRDEEGFKEVMMEGPVRKVFEGTYPA